MAVNALKQNDPDAPLVASRIVGSPGNDFRGHVLTGTDNTQRRRTVPTPVSPAKQRFAIA